jgi:hypothetical protein
MDVFSSASPYGYLREHDDRWAGRSRHGHLVFLQRAMPHNLCIEDIAAVDAPPHRTLTQIDTGQNIVSIRKKQPLTTFTVHTPSCSACGPAVDSFKKRT